MSQAPNSPDAPASLRTRWLLARNRWLMDPRLQALAWKLPFVRSIARRRAGALFDLVAGFTYSQWLHVGVRLGVFEALAQAPQTEAAVAELAGLEAPAARQLLRALVALDLAEMLDDGRATLGQHGAALMANEGVRAMVAHHDLLFADLADPVALLRRRGGGRLSAYWPYAEGGEGGDVVPYSRLMAASQPMVAAAVLDAVDFSGVGRLLDVGGGEGAFLEAVLARHPNVQPMLFDLPEVVARASARLGERLERHGGRFPADPLPAGADMVTLVRILHDHNDATVLDLLCQVRACLAPGKRLLAVEPMAGTPGARAMGDAYFGFYLLAMGSGRPRTAKEITEMLHAAGFARVQQIPTRNPFAAQILEAR
jgi:demethylspheroidene O-methyltransferase